MRSPLLVAFALLVGLVIVGAGGDSQRSQKIDLGIEEAPDNGAAELGYVGLSDGLRVRLVRLEVAKHERSRRRIVEVEVEIENTTDVVRRFPKQAFKLELTDGRLVSSERTTQNGEECRLVIDPNSRMVGTAVFGLQGYDPGPQSLVVLDPLAPSEAIALLSLDADVVIN